MVYERSLVSRSTGGSKQDGDGKIPPVARVKSVGPFAHAAAYATTTSHGTGSDSRTATPRNRDPPPLLATNDRYGRLQRNEKRRLS